MADRINSLSFSFGLLFGLRHAGVTSFISSGEHFHDAFGAVLDELNKPDAPRVEEYTWLATCEHRMGLSRRASQFITDGMHGGLLTLDSPGYRRARLTISARAARSELDRYAPEERPDWFETLGRIFATALRQQGCAERPRHCPNCGHSLDG